MLRSSFAACVAIEANDLDVMRALLRDACARAHSRGHTYLTLDWPTMTRCLPRRGVVCTSRTTAICTCCRGTCRIRRPASMAGCHTSRSQRSDEECRGRTGALGARRPR